MHKCHNIPDDTESPSQTWNAMGKLTLHRASCCETPGRKSKQGQQKRRFLSLLAYSQSFFLYQTSWNIMSLVLIVSFGIDLRPTITFCSLTFLAAKDFLGSWDMKSRSVWTSKDPHGWLWSTLTICSLLVLLLNMTWSPKLAGYAWARNNLANPMTRKFWPGPAIWDEHDLP